MAPPIPATAALRHARSLAAGLRGAHRRRRLLAAPAAGLLRELCEQADVEAVETSCGGEVAGELLDGLTWTELSTVLAETLNAAQRDPDVSQRERRNDREAIREAAAACTLMGLSRSDAYAARCSSSTGDSRAIGKYQSNPTSTSA